MEYKMNSETNISHFSIYQQHAPNKHRERETREIFHFLNRLGQFIKLDDVRFGKDPPDFVICLPDKKIGLELTDVDPTIFEKNGNHHRGAYKKWRKDIVSDGLPHQFLGWGKYSLRESLAALKHRIIKKIEDTPRWADKFSERFFFFIETTC